MMRQAGAKWLYEIYGGSAWGGDHIDPYVCPSQLFGDRDLEDVAGEAGKTPANVLGGLRCQAFPPYVTATAGLQAA